MVFEIIRNKLLIQKRLCFEMNDQNEEKRARYVDDFWWKIEVLNSEIIKKKFMLKKKF